MIRAPRGAKNLDEAIDCSALRPARPSSGAGSRTRRTAPDILPSVCRAALRRIDWPRRRLRRRALTAIPVPDLRERDVDAAREVSLTRRGSAGATGWAASPLVHGVSRPRAAARRDGSVARRGDGGGSDDGVARRGAAEVATAGSRGGARAKGATTAASPGGAVTRRHRSADGAFGRGRRAHVAATATATPPPASAASSTNGDATRAHRARPRSPRRLSRPYPVGRVSGIVSSIADPPARRRPSAIAPSVRAQRGADPARREAALATRTCPAAWRPRACRPARRRARGARC